MVTTTPPVIDYPKDYEPPRRLGVAVVAVVSGVALGLALLASAFGVAALISTHRTPAPTPPTPAPVYSPQQIKAARDHACGAAAGTGAVMKSQRRPSLTNPDDRSLFAAEQAGIAAGVEFIRSELPPALPADVRDAINAYADAQIHVSAADAKLIYTDFERFGHSDAQARRQAALDNVTEAEKRANAANTRMVTLCRLG